MPFSRSDPLFTGRLFSRLLRSSDKGEQCGQLRDTKSVVKHALAISSLTRRIANTKPVDRIEKSRFERTVVQENAWLGGN